MADIDIGPANNFAFLTHMAPEQFTQELRITSPAEGAFDFVAGLYYIDQLTVGKNRAFPSVRFGPAEGEFTQGRDIDVNGFSVFAHGNYHFSEALTLFGGLRYLTETKKSWSHALTCPTNPILPVGRLGCLPVPSRSQLHSTRRPMNPAGPSVCATTLTTM